MGFDYHKHACRDRMCGADDCPNCHPENFMGVTYVFDDNEAGPEDDDDEEDPETEE